MLSHLALLFTLAAGDAGETPEALHRQMKAWLEPARSTTRTLAMTVRSGDGTAVEWTGRQARGRLGDANFALTVILEPADVRGTALLVREQAGQPTERWVYVPALRRVRRLQLAEVYTSFLNTEFTVADFGFVELKDRTLSLLGRETLDGRDAFKLQEVPADQRTFSRIVDWIAADTKQPLKREYYDVGGRLWMVETFEDVATVHGVPTAQRVRMEDRQSGYGSEYRIRDLAYDVQISPHLFDWQQLSTAADTRW